MKNTYLISYDLKDGSSEDYEELKDFIKSYGTWAHVTESLWAIMTEEKATEIRDELKEILPDGSSIFVIKSGVESAWSNVICKSKWLKDNI